MRRPLAALFLLLIGCSALPQRPTDATTLTDEVFVQPLVPGVWRHVSYRRFPGGLFSSNGLVVRTSDGALVVDTAWNDHQTSQVLEWAQREIGPVSAVIITHAHDDRIGGIGAVHERGIESVALVQTAHLAQSDGWPTPTRTVSSGFSLERYGIAGELFFPGAGHSPDNAVVYFPAQSVLAGTCMVRSLEAQSLGNLDDADLTEWPRSVLAIQSRYAQVSTVVPGHGPPGDARLLAHTLSLLGLHGR